MELNDWRLKECEAAIIKFIDRRRPPADLRNQIDLSWRRKGRSFEIFEIVPNIQEDGEFIEHPVAKATYVKSREKWRVYWQMADLKWHVYEPDPEVNSFNDFIDIVDKDKLCCFFG